MSGGAGTNLPKELLLLIADKLDKASLINFSCTSWHYREQFGPSIFRNLHGTDDEVGAEVGLSILKTYGEHVRHLRLDLDVRNWTIPEYQLCDAAASLLQGHMTPALRSITLRFCLMTYDHDDHYLAWEEPSEIDCLRYTAWAELQTIKDARTRWKWHNGVACPTAFAEVWSSLAINRTIRSLRIDQLLPLGPPIVYRPDSDQTPGFNHFLGRLEHLGIAVSPMNNTGARLVSLSAMSATWFQHLENLKSLKLSYPDEIDFRALLYADRAWRPQLYVPNAQLPFPRLESLTLHKMFIGANLLNLLCARSDVIKYLHLEGCVCSMQDDISYFWHQNRPSYGRDYSWAGFFQALYERSPVLEELHITPRNAFDSATVTANIDIGYGEGRNPHEGKQSRLSHWCHPAEEYAGGIHQMLANDSRLHLFEYFVTTPVTVGGHLESVRRFRLGEDQRKYEQLMRLVEQNRHRRKDGETRLGA